jgi:tRNA pseudouridine38-40 synthase
MSALFVPDSLHPRHDAQKKTYIYKILITEERNPLFNRYHYCTNYNLDYINMNQACRYFIGTHDFSAFCASNSSTVNKIRTITHLSISISYIQNIGQELTVSIKGNGFLYNMVRIIVGTLIEVGRGNINKNIIPDILISKDRKRAGTTARASGLCLQNIEYKNPSIR